MTKNFWNKVLIGLGIIVVFLQTLILAYIYKKNGGTTGGDPVTPIFPFAISLIIALFIFLKEYKISNRTLNLTVITVSIFGCLLPYWLERIGILVQYERWLHNERFINTENLGMRLMCFVGVELFVVIGIVATKYYWFNSKSKLK